MDDLSFIINQDQNLFFFEIEKKINECQKKLSKDSKDIPTISQLAKYSSQIKNNDLSIYFASEATRLKPKSLKLKLDLFHYLLINGNVEEVCKKIKKLFLSKNLIEGSKDSSLLLKLINLFGHYCHDHVSTIDFVEKLYTKFPDDNNVIMTYAFVNKMFLGNIKKSRKLIARLIKRNFINQYVMSNWLDLYQKDNPKKTLLLCDILKKKYPNLIDLINHYNFNCYATIGDKEKANFYLDKNKDSLHYVTNKIRIDALYIKTLDLNIYLNKFQMLVKHQKSMNLLKLSGILSSTCLIIAKKYEFLKDFKRKNYFLEKSHYYFFKHNYLSLKNNLNSDSEMPKNLYKKSKKAEVLINKRNFNMKLQPIFIVGLPRSGSSILEKTIFENFNIKACGETQIIQKYIINILSKKQNFDFLNLYKNEFMDIDKFEGFTDKTLNNFSYINLIIKYYPNAKFINCMRNPKENVLSIFNIIFENQPWAHSLENILDYANQYFILMDKFKKLYPKNILTIKHSDLVLNKEKVLENIFDFLKMKKNTIKNPLTQSFFGTTESQWQIRQKVSNKFLNKYSKDYYILDKYLKKYKWLNQ